MHTIILPCLPRAPLPMHLQEGSTLFFDQSINCKLGIERHSPIRGGEGNVLLGGNYTLLRLTLLPASLAIPFRPASTHDTLHIPQTNLSFPPFIHPCSAAATASICDGLFAYVASLYVVPQRRSVFGHCMDWRCRWVLEDAVRARMAVRWGAHLERSMVSEMLGEEE